MSRQTWPPLPRVQRTLVELGRNIRLARVRRKIPAGLLAERAGLSRPTLRAIERGSRSVTLGAVANVLNSLGLADDLALVGRNDVLGQQLEVIRLETVRRVRRRRSDG